LPTQQTSIESLAAVISILKNHTDANMALEIIQRSAKLIMKVVSNKDDEDLEVIKKLFEVLNLSFKTLTMPRPGSLLGSSTLEASADLQTKLIRDSCIFDVFLCTLEVIKFTY
jgi:hypothetical protein